MRCISVRVRARLHAYQSVSSRNATCVTLVHGGGGGGEKSQDCEGKLFLILLISRSVGLEDVPRGSRARTVARTHTHNTPGLSRKASVATWRAGVMTSIMSPYSEGEQERESQWGRKWERESTLLSLALGVLLSLALRELLVLGSNSSAVQPCGVGGWEDGGSNWYSKMPWPWKAFLWREGGLCVLREVRATVDRPPPLFLPFFSLLFSLSHQPDWSIFQSPCCCMFTAVQYVIFNITGTCQLSILLGETQTHVSFRAWKCKYETAHWSYYGVPIWGQKAGSYKVNPAKCNRFKQHLSRRRVRVCWAHTAAVNLIRKHQAILEVS